MSLKVIFKALGKHKVSLRDKFNSTGKVSELKGKNLLRTYIFCMNI